MFSFGREKMPAITLHLGHVAQRLSTEESENVNPFIEFQSILLFIRKITDCAISLSACDAVSETWLFHFRFSSLLTSLSRKWAEPLQPLQPLQRPGTLTRSSQPWLWPGHRSRFRDTQQTEVSLSPSTLTLHFK